MILNAIQSMSSARESRNHVNGCSNQPASGLTGNNTSTAEQGKSRGMMSGVGVSKDCLQLEFPAECYTSANNERYKMEHTVGRYKALDFTAPCRFEQPSTK